jgi:hypothetical protein
MKLAYVFGPLLMVAVPAVALAQDVLQPKFPPGFDCASVPAGAEREECRQSQLNPTTDNDLNKDRFPTGGALQTPGTVSPPTVPNEPGSENRDSGPGSSSGAGGVGN